MDKAIFEANVEWGRNEQEVFVGNKFSRSHRWQFDGGVSVPATASHQIVPLPYSKPENVDPEEAFVATLSSCHMMAFLAVASKKKYVVDSYIDHAMGVLEQGEGGRFSMTQVTLRPNIVFSGARTPSKETIEKMHNVAHQNCFIANSVKTEINIEF
ncbi:OsmC family protein [Photobacterium sp. BZF1]|uniref:OsmC family protein n=1 Tax=Photobacterium sp. BZF1 TaxID=1904457 RepID=UPI001653D48A|nr:OsmC family protein [Photobacterium sp. BZF1]